MTLPELNIPDVKFDPDTVLSDPSTITRETDIPDADEVISKLIEDFKKEGLETAWLEPVKGFTHEDKVKWIMSLPETSRLEPMTCLGILAVYTMYVTIMIMVAIDAAGDPVYKEKVVEKKVTKCVPKQ